MSTYETSETSIYTEDEIKSGGTSQTLIVCATDQVTELILVDKLKLPMFRYMTVLVLDLKMVSIITGLSEATPAHGCPYCLSRWRNI